MEVNAAGPPVLVTAFNRPHLLSDLLERLRTIGITRLFVSVDGPREGNFDDIGAVRECVLLASTIDWVEDIHIRVGEHNLGCAGGMQAALDWFFSHAERGVILEDDILPDETFFGFCSTLLDRYADDDRVLAISGSCLVPPAQLADSRSPYRFSAVPHVWGWATWRRAWNRVEPDLSDWRSRIDSEALWDAVQGSVAGALYWGSVFEAVRRRRLDTWDAALVLEAMRSGKVTATANVNLTQNRGFGPGATHTTDTAWQPPPSASLRGDLVDAPVARDAGADAWTHRHHFQVHKHLRRALSDDDPYFVGFRDEIRELAARVGRS